MKNLIVAALALGLTSLASGYSFADSKDPLLHANLKGFQEVPAVSTVATGQFRATIVNDTTIAYELTYAGLEGTVTQAHIHFGQKSVSGGISLWLCQTATNKDPTNLAPTCPQEANGNTAVTGVLTAANLVGPSAQGIAGGASGGAPEEFAEILKAIKAGVTYANVHSSKVGSGEIRGQIEVTRGKQDNNNSR